MKRERIEKSAPYVLVDKNNYRLDQTWLTPSAAEKLNAALKDGSQWVHLGVFDVTVGFGS